MLEINIIRLGTWTFAFSHCFSILSSINSCLCVCVGCVCECVFWNTALQIQVSPFIMWVLRMELGHWVSRKSLYQLSHLNGTQFSILCADSICTNYEITWCVQVSFCQLDTSWTHWEEGSSPKELSPPDWPGHFLDYGLM